MPARPTEAPPADAGPAMGAALDQRIAERLRFQLITLGRSTQLGAFLAAVLTWTIFLSLTGRASVLVWAALIHSAQLVRSYFLRRTTGPVPSDGHAASLPPEAARHVLSTLAVASVVWGLSAWILIPPGAASEAQAPILLVVLFGMMAGSIPAIMPSRRAIAAWLLPITLVLAARFAWQGGVQGWVTCVCTLLFGAVMARFVVVQHRLHVASLRDQFEKEALSQQILRQSRELERLNQERSRFFASASHDLRQPVHALALFSRSLQRDLRGHALEPVAERVVRATDAVSHLLNAMLDISKIDAGAVVPQPADVAVDQIFLRLSQLFDSRAAQAGLRLRFHTAPEWMHTDGEIVLRILANFVDNALKYTTHGGVLVSARPRGDRLRLAVWDTGRGVALADQPRIFEEFYQADNPQRDVARGLGIGLAIVRRLATLLGGEAGVRSVAGRGSVFWIDLPRRLPGAPDTPAASRAHSAPVPLELPARNGGGQLPRVLLLDDEAAVGEAVRIWLGPHCARIEVTQTVADAHARVAAEPDGFDAFIVDFRLADALNGIEATALLRQVAGRAVPTILVTGDTDPERVRAAYASGLAVQFKPVQPEQLLATLRGLMQQAAAPA